MFLLCVEFFGQSWGARDDSGHEESPWSADHCQDDNWSRTSARPATRLIYCPRFSHHCETFTRRGQLCLQHCPALPSVCMDKLGETPSHAKKNERFWLKPKDKQCKCTRCVQSHSILIKHFFRSKANLNPEWWKRSKLNQANVKPSR